MLERIDARLLIVIAAVLFSTGGAAVKSTSLGGFEVAFLRSGVAFVALMLLVPSCRRNWHWRTGLVAVSYAATLIFFVLATKLTTSANAIFLQATAPLYLLFLAPWLLREAITRRDVGFMLVMAVGLALLFAGQTAPTNIAPDPAKGNLLGAASGITWALTLLGLRALARRDGGESATTAAAMGNLVACVACAAFVLPLTQVSTHDWLAIAYLGIVQIALAYWIVTFAMARVPALEASLLILVEPVLNPVWSWWLHGESPGPMALAAGLLIIAATAARTFTTRPTA
ncbi:MAG: DMT family transporter [Gammaproteobacteria bacterium]